MGKPDEYYYDYLDDNGRFADQMNGALFQGEQVVSPDELEAVDAQLVYLGREAGGRKNFKATVDKARMWKGNLVHIMLVEHQTYVDYQMVLRNMLSESLNYHKQWKQKKALHESGKDLPAGIDAFFRVWGKTKSLCPSLPWWCIAVRSTHGMGRSACMICWKLTKG